MDNKRLLYALLALSFILLTVYALSFSQYREAAVDFVIAPTQINSVSSVKNIAKLFSKSQKGTENTTLMQGFSYFYA